MLTPPLVVVGVDGLTDTGPAVRWAATQADAHGWDVLLVHCVEEPAPGARPGDWSTGPGPGRLTHELRARQSLARAERICREVSPGTRTTLQVSWQPPRTALADAARDARLLVVGARTAGHPRVRLGSTSRHLVQHAACAVVVVREPARSSPRGVVVGVDGSVESRHTAEVAAVAAAEAGDDLLVVVAWLGVVAPGRRPVDWIRRHAASSAEHRRLLDETTASARARCPGTTVTGELVEGGFAAQVLVGRSRGARLLVVGRRHHGRVASTLLGSTGADVLHSARCPVLVVPGALVPDVLPGPLGDVGAAPAPGRSPR